MANPYEKALDLYDLEEFQAILEQYMGQYASAGGQALSTLQDQYMTLINNPAAINEMLGSTYQQSPGYEYQMEQSMNAANQAASAGGMLGTQSHQTTAMTQSQNIANQDYWQYLNYMTGLYELGIGLASDLNKMGYSANAAMMDEIVRFIGAEIGLTAESHLYSNQQTNDLISGIIGGLGGSGGGFF